MDSMYRFDSPSIPVPRNMLSPLLRSYPRFILRMTDASFKGAILCALTEEIKKQAGPTMREAVEALETVLVLIKSTVQRGEDVSISGFGTFMVRSKRARQGRNPHTGQPVTIAPRRVVTFRASALFKAYVNGGSMPGRTLLSSCHDPLVQRSHLHD